MISIIGVLAAVAIPAYNNYKVNAKDNIVKTSSKTIVSALQTCLALGDITGCSATSNLQLKNVANTVAQGSGANDLPKDQIGVAKGAGSDATKICYDIALGGHLDAQGCADGAGTAHACKRDGANTFPVATAGKCAAGACPACPANSVDI